MCDDKYLFNTHMVNLGFEHLIPKTGISGKFPYILKKRVDVSGNNCHIVINKEQEGKHNKRIADDDFFTQELVPGTVEYATHILFKNDRIVNSLNIKYTFDTEFPVKGQQNPLYTRIAGCPHLDVFSKILREIRFEGLCCFNYKEKDNLPMIIEINPRCGYSLSPYLYYFIHQSVYINSK